ncbi:hypothetical protein ACFL6U_16700 [Planctomycetota bacterium]
MARYRGQKALYEVMGQSRSGKNQRQRLEPLRSDEKTPKAPEKVAPLPVSNHVEAHWLKPRPLQLNAGRIELTVSYPVACVCLLTILLLILAAYQLGRAGRSASAEPAPESFTPAPATPEQVLNPVKSSEPTIGQGAGQDNVEPQGVAAVPTELPRSGRNAILILSHSDRAQLVPVRGYFALYGIKSEICPAGSGYMLVTLERFEGRPVNPDSAGYPLLRKIIELGAAYEPPPNFLPFTPESFAGAHGILIND